MLEINIKGLCMKLFSGLMLSLGMLTSLAQEQVRLVIPYADFEPSLDFFEGMKPNPQVKDKMARVSGFIQRNPDDGQPASHETEVYASYDRKFLYFVFLAFDSEPDKIRARMSPREQVFQDDYVDVQLDTFNDQRRAYTFLSTPLGLQWDAQWTEGGDFDQSYDALWYSEGRRNELGYMVRIRIPFNTLRFPRNQVQTWRVLFNRSIPRLSEESFWPRYSNQIVGRLNQAAVLEGIHDVSPGRNIQLTPYAFARSLDILDPNHPEGPRFVGDDFDPEAGLDAKMVVKDSFVLDLTLNPDFSQVESDEPQITVNQRFEVFFQEKRPFFLENADLFHTPTNLVFTRRIIEPNAGLRFTGKKGNYGLGLMLIDDEAAGLRHREDDPLSKKAAEIGILRLTRDLSSQSTIGLLYTQREHGPDYNRIFSLDGRIKLNNNWVANIQAAGGETREGGTGDALTRKGTTYNASVNRSGRHLEIHNHFLRTSEDFRTRLGFLQGEGRPGVLNLHNQTAYIFRPEKSAVQALEISLRSERIWDLDNEPLDTIFRPEIQLDWAAGTKLEIGYNHLKQRLTPSDFESLIQEITLTESRWRVEFESSRLSSLTLGVEVEMGESINFEPAELGPLELVDSQEIRGNLVWRPISPLTIDNRYFYLKLASREDGGKIFTNEIGRSRWNWQFTRELSLRMIAQYSKTSPDALRTSLQDEENLNTDILLRYVLNPWTAFYLGYNGNQSNYEIIEPEDRPAMVIRPGQGLKTDGRQYFLKCTWLFRF